MLNQVNPEDLIGPHLYPPSPSLKVRVMTPLIPCSCPPLMRPQPTLIGSLILCSSEVIIGVTITVITIIIVIITVQVTVITAVQVNAAQEPLARTVWRSLRRPPAARGSAVSVSGRHLDCSQS